MVSFSSATVHSWLDLGGLRFGMLIPSIIVGALAAAVATDVISFETTTVDPLTNVTSTANTMAFLLELRRESAESIPHEYVAQTVTVSVLVGLASFCIIAANVGMAHLGGFCLNTIGTLLVMIEVGIFSQLRTDFNTNYATPESGRFGERILWGPALTFHIVCATALIFACVAQFALWGARRKGKRPRYVFYCAPQIIAILSCCGGLRAAQGWHEGRPATADDGRVPYVGWHYFEISVDAFIFDKGLVCDGFRVLNAVLSGVVALCSLFSLASFTLKAMRGRTRSTLGCDAMMVVCGAVSIGLAASHRHYACESWEMIHFGPSIYLMAVALLGALIEVAMHLRQPKTLDYIPLLN